MAILLNGTDLGEESEACVENTGVLLTSFTLKKEEKKKPFNPLEGNKL